MPPEFVRPSCSLTSLGKEGEPSTHWTMIHAVCKTLRLNGLGQQATEFAGRAAALPIDGDDTTDLIALIVQYVDIE